MQNQPCLLWLLVCLIFTTHVPAQRLMEKLDRGDGRAEVIAKTAPLDVDARDASGRVLTGPEWFTIFDGLTGEALATTDWIARGDISDWGDSYGNRVNRNLMCIAYLDGIRPSVVIFRGTYGLMKAEAWNFRDGQLSRVWQWSNEGLGAAYQGQGFHNIRVGDVDGDGRDEILNGALLLDDNGDTLYSTGEGHGDRFVLSDIDPDHPGLETFYIQEGGYTHAIHLRNSRTGELLWGAGDASWGDVGRGLTAEIDPTHRGLESWPPSHGVYSATGDQITTNAPSYASSFVCEYAVWWDDNLMRELTQGDRLLKWDYQTRTTPRIGTASGTLMAADVIGDWREEIIGIVNNELRIYTTIIPSTRRFYTFMHDPIYRSDVASMGMGYLQSANPSFYVADDMAPPPIPDIALLDPFDPNHVWVDFNKGNPL